MLFSVVMEMIFKEAACCLLWNVLYADDLVVMDESEEALGGKILM